MHIPKSVKRQNKKGFFYLMQGVSMLPKCFRLYQNKITFKKYKLKKKYKLLPVLIYPKQW